MSKVLALEEIESVDSLSKLCSSLTEPVFITRAGYGDMVAMSQDLYTSLIGNFSKKEENESAVRPRREGQGSDVDDVLKELKERLDLS